jgi:nitroreductase
MPSNSEIVLGNIHSRKSVRNYTGQKTGRETLMVLMRAGMAAPSAKNIRPWVFIGVTDPEVLQKLAKGLPFAKMLPKAGAAIAVCGDMEKASAGTHHEMWVQDCSAVTQNILLAAESMGLGAVWTACYPHRERFHYAAGVLGVPSSVIPFCLIAVGYPTGEDLPQDKYDPGLIRWDRWQTE